MQSSYTLDMGKYGVMYWYTCKEKKTYLLRECCCGAVLVVRKDEKRSLQNLKLLNFLVEWLMKSLLM